MSTYLDRILASHRAAADGDRRDLAVLHREATLAPPVRGFRTALVKAAMELPGQSRLAVIAEFKRRSPSKGDLAPDRDPGFIAAAFTDGGATCLSVLTDAEFFGGSPEDLRAARAASALPVLRKDFTVGQADVFDARIMGADAVLLIAAALSDGELGMLAATAAEIGMDALVEVHDEAELERALAAGADLVGVNQRDLGTFEVDHTRAERVVAAIPSEVVAVAESGVRDRRDALRLAVAGYQAVLVGESVVTAGDPAAAVGALRVPLGGDVGTPA